MTKPARAPRAFAVKFRSDLKVRDLQNGIGIASVLGIVLIVVIVALGSGPPPRSSDLAAANDATASLTPSGDGAAPSDTPFAPSSLFAPTSPIPSNGALPSGSSATSGSTGNAAAMQTRGTQPTTSPRTTRLPAGPVSGTQPRGSGASAITATSQPEVGAPTSEPQPSTATTTSTTAPTVDRRPVEGTAVTLAAGTYVGGTDVAPGLYDVTTGPDQSGDFIVTGTDSYNEVLDSSGTQGVPEVRARIATGDQIQLSGMSQVFFTPVTTPFVTTHETVTLYAGTWRVGQDVGPGPYVAVPGAGETGSIVVKAEGVDEVFSDGQSPDGASGASFSVQNGDVIQISGLAQVVLTPS